MKFTRINVDSSQSVSFPYIRNSGIPVATILDLLQQRMKEEEILAMLPSLELQDIEEAKRYAYCHKIAGRLISIEQVQEVCQQIGSAFNPERIILFGSYAYGTPHRGSDIDLLIVMDFEGRSLEKSMEIWSLIKPEFPIDLIVRTPEEVKWRYQQFDPLIRCALDKGKIMYERRSARVVSQS